MMTSDFSGRFDRAFAALKASVDEGRIPGGVLGLVDGEGRRLTQACGAAALEPEKRPMTTETWFDLASLTKVIFTTERILALAGEGCEQAVALELRDGDNRRARRDHRPREPLPEAHPRNNVLFFRVKLANHTSQPSFGGELLRLRCVPDIHRPEM